MPSFKEGFFSSAGELKLYYRFYPKEAAEHTLVIVHGHGEHCGRYEKFAAVLKDYPVSIATLDLRGHGRSEGAEVYVDSYEDFLQDITAFVLFLESQGWVRGKFILLGHSNGGLISCHWAMRHPEKIQAMILSSPFLGLRLPKPLRILNYLLNRLCPRFVYQNPIYPPYLTHNLAEVENYKKDRLIRRKISVRLLNEMILYIRKLESFGEFQLPFPVYILAAGQERVVDLRKTKNFFQKLRVPAKELKIFEGFYHEIFNELEQEKVFDALKKHLDTLCRFR
jgi:alpha-beta hydrolase superfamily lysophospholipase